MPQTKKGQKIKRAMKKEYGAKKGEQVFYASANKGTIKGVHKSGGSSRGKKGRHSGSSKSSSRAR